MHFFALLITNENSFYCEIFIIILYTCFISLFFTLLSSFGFTEKGSGKISHQAIGVYGNGFKSGSMRLGRDALIFTKNGGCQTVGMLSQTYLENIKAQAVIVPIVPFNQQTNILSKWMVFVLFCFVFVLVLSFLFFSREGLTIYGAHYVLSIGMSLLCLTGEYKDLKKNTTNRWLSSK